MSIQKSVKQLRSQVRSNVLAHVDPNCLQKSSMVFKLSLLASKELIITTRITCICFIGPESDLMVCEFWLWGICVLAGPCLSLADLLRPEPPVFLMLYSTVFTILYIQNNLKIDRNKGKSQNVNFINISASANLQISNIVLHFS